MDIKDTLSEIDFKIRSNNIVYVTTNNNNIKKTKQINISDLINCLLSARDQGNDGDNKKNIVFEDLGTLANTDNVKTVRTLISQDGNTIIYVLFRKNNKVNISYYNDVFKGIELPNILFSLKTVNGAVTSSCVCCVKKDTKIIEDNTKIYRFPLSNVYNNTRICWGANKIYSNKIVNSMDIAKIPYMFLTAPYNDDMYASKIPFRKLMEKIQKEKCFDESTLIPLEYNFGEWIDKIKYL